MFEKNRNGRIQQHLIQQTFGGSSIRSFASQSSGEDHFEHLKQDEDPEHLKKKLLQASLYQAIYRGFNDEAIVAGCRDLDLPAVTGTIITKGPFDIVIFAQDEWLKQMREDVKRYHKKIANPETGQETELIFSDLEEKLKIKVGIKRRLQAMSLYIDKWPQGMALGLRPENLATTLSQLYKISDEVWYLAGDRSTDISWYNKRHQLTKVYIVTELYMIQDKSQGYDQTWQFLDRRLDEMYGLLELMDKQAMMGILGSLQVGASAIASIFSSENLQMDDSLMEQYQEMLKNNMADAQASGSQEEQQGNNQKGTDEGDDGKKMEENKKES